MKRQVHIANQNKEKANDEYKTSVQNIESARQNWVIKVLTA